MLTKQAIIRRASALPLRVSNTVLSSDRSARECDREISGEGCKSEEEGRKGGEGGGTWRLGEGREGQGRQGGVEGRGCSMAGRHSWLDVFKAIVEGNGEYNNSCVLSTEASQLATIATGAE